MSQPSAVGTPGEISTRRSRWRWALPAQAVALLALALALYDPAWRLWDLWIGSFEYGHGVVVVPVILYLLWLRRDEFAAESPAPDLRGLVLTAVLMAAWFSARVLGLVLGEQILLVLLLLSVTLGVLGARITTIAALPVLYLLFAVPIWSYMSPAMQSVTAEVSAAMARTLGVPLYLEGLYMTIPDGRFLVAETCSGLRYLLASLSLGGFYALLNLHNAWARLGILLFCAGLGIVFNWVRVVGIVLIGHHSQMQSPMVGEHITFGWVLFLGVVVATLLVGRLLERLEGPLPPARAPAAAPTRGTRALLVAATVSAGLVLVPAIIAAQVLRLPIAVPAMVFPASLGDGRWSEVPRPESSGWQPRFQGVTVERLSRYLDGKGDREEWVDVYVAYYPVQRQDAEVVNERNQLYDSDRWRRYSQEAVPTRVAAAPGLPMAEYRLVRKKASTRRLVWWSYWVNGEFTPDPLRAKWLQLRAALADRPEAAGLLLSTEVRGEDDIARERLSAFARDASGPLSDVLEKATRQP